MATAAAQSARGERDWKEPALDASPLIRATPKQWKPFLSAIRGPYTPPKVVVAKLRELNRLG
ncbi:MAG TPA: hypothetical protein VF577_07860, partial [Allosphingosinicella sp.]